jgi:hypothetical protein
VHAAAHAAVPMSIRPGSARAFCTSSWMLLIGPPGLATIAKGLLASIEIMLKSSTAS